MGTVINRIADVLEQYKEEHKINNKDLAEFLEVSESYISRVLRDQRGKHVSIEVLNRICDKLKITPNDLLWEEN